MTKLKKLIAPALAAVMAMGVAVPAQANYYDDPRQIRQELRAFEGQIDRKANRGQISERNATWLSYRLRGAQRQFRQFRRGGFNSWRRPARGYSKTSGSREGWATRNGKTTSSYSIQ